METLKIDVYSMFTKPDAAPENQEIMFCFGERLAAMQKVWFVIRFRANVLNCEKREKQKTKLFIIL